MASKLFLIFIAAAIVPWLVCGQEFSPPCDFQLEACVAAPETQYQNSLATFQVDLLCTSLKNLSACYSQSLNLTECVNQTQTLTDLQTETNANIQIMCPNGQPSPCLTGLRNCTNTYKSIATPAASTTAKCKAAADAQACLAPLQCAGQLAPLKSKLSQTISVASTASNCMANSANATECEKRAAACINPIENLLLKDENDYNFDSMCSTWPQVVTCFNQLTQDSNCSSVQVTLDTQMASLKARYNQYCDANNQPLACMKNLEQCTQDYQDLAKTPSYQAMDPLIYCQGLKILLACMNSLSANISSCPALADMQAIASRQIEQGQYNSTCAGRVMDGCTSTAAQCVAQKSVKLFRAQYLDDWSKVCTFAADFNKCLDPYLSSTQCQSNPYLLAERTFITNNVTSLVCQPNQPDQPLPCLLQVQTCTQNYVHQLNTAKTGTFNTFCQDADQLRGCLDKINDCPPKLQTSLVTARQQASAQCPTNSNSTSGPNSLGATPLLVSLTLVVFALLKVTLE